MKSIRSKLKKLTPFRSSKYWEQRYAQGGTSGAGSFGRLADYKAKFINDFAEEHGMAEAIEFGSGDGNQCSQFKFQTYIGVDVSHNALASCREKFRHKTGWRFLHYDDPQVGTLKSPLVLSLDVIFHLVEDRVFNQYMEKLFSTSTKYVLIYSSDHDANTGNRHVRHREYSDWIKERAAQFSFEAEWPHPYPMTDNSDPNETSFANFQLFQIIDKSS